MRDQSDGEVEDSRLEEYDEEEKPTPFGLWLLLVGAILLIIKGALALIEAIGN